MYLPCFAKPLCSKWLLFLETLFLSGIQHMAATSLIKCNFFSQFFVERKKKTWPTMTMTKAPLVHGRNSIWWEIQNLSEKLTAALGQPPRHQPGQNWYRPSRINPSNISFKQNLNIFDSLWTRSEQQILQDIVQYKPILYILYYVRRVDQWEHR